MMFSGAKHAEGRGPRETSINIRFVGAGGAGDRRHGGTIPVRRRRTLHQSGCEEADPLGRELIPLNGPTVTPSDSIMMRLALIY